MGAIEKRHSKKLRQTRVNQAVLGTIGIAGALAVVALAPGVFSVMKYAKHLPQKRKEVQETLKKALEGEYVCFEVRNKKRKLVLTDKGKLFVSLIEDKKFKPSQKKKWDGFWRVLVFDISEKRKHVRDRLRELLRLLDFVKLQGSVWITPYPCDDAILIIKSELRLGVNVRYLLVQELEHDKALRTHFSLPTCD